MFYHAVYTTSVNLCCKDFSDLLRGCLRNPRYPSSHSKYEVLRDFDKGFENLTGYTADEMLYQDCRFLQGNDRDQVSLDKVRKAIKKKEPCREIIRNYRKDGSMFWNELSITPIFDDQNQLTYFIGVQKDVTELMQLREKNS
ncbi:MAG TPA: PAS domain-containing protein [Marinospirillum sp.]|uniref:PAS domain-containing protein n=1 Tax=Marinospirillum sp. TaxID=2183934 RepID=UPI002B488B37|nr:PAS domain-containing protein [Marinospirillum sp.]HKM15867.1 PAS domain-containing protein [Marinospirillum sp.]